MIFLQRRKGQDSPYFMHNEKNTDGEGCQICIPNRLLATFRNAITATRFGLRRHGKVLLGCALAAVSVLWAIQLEVGPGELGVGGCVESC